MQDEEQMTHDDVNENAIPSSTPPGEALDKSEEYLNGWRRALADYENLKRATTAERAQWSAIITADAITAFLPVYDYLQAALARPPEIPGVEKWFDGVRYTLQQFMTTLAQFNVVKLEVMGKHLKPDESEAVGTERDETKEDGVVLKEVQTGFSMNGKIIRIAKVIVNNLN